MLLRGGAEVWVLRPPAPPPLGISLRAHQVCMGVRLCSSQTLTSVMSVSGKGARQWVCRQSLDLWCKDECVLDFDERSIEEGELLEDEEEEDRWASSGGWGRGPLILFLIRCREHGKGSRGPRDGCWKEPRWRGGRYRSGHSHCLQVRKPERMATRY
ncbi:hypothetical protein NDU88_002308 [Pleurodeles waltl]|uniref:Uncharacterized protein n=1 Tax=Pleurodeles waltl TaxID=8319 RepID=A0AAV7LC67_PLEWA|nr:hypothetical protein NDU88_002308 [Pleurodeles waltl]